MLNTILAEYQASREKMCGIRLGQYFCNKYIKEQYPVLFYCKDDTESIELIKQWLLDNDEL